MVIAKVIYTISKKIKCVYRFFHLTSQHSNLNEVLVKLK